MKNPKISVIMSDYNGLPYLPQAVESILNQTYKNFEFIIIDDGSKDDSWQYLKGLKDKRIKLYKNQKNLGLAASLNKALLYATGDYIARMDSDDISLPQRLEKQVKFLGNHDVDICGTSVKLIDKNNKIIGKLNRPTSDRQIKRLINWATPLLIHPTWMAKKIVYDFLGGYNPKFDLVEDYEFLLRAKKFKMANLKQQLLLWRIYPERRSRKDIQKMYEMDFQIKWTCFKNGQLSFLFVPLLIYKFFTTYLLPPNLKLFFIERTKIA